MNRSKVARLAAKLDIETFDGKVVWVVKSPPLELVRGTSDVIHSVFETEYAGVRLRVFEKRVKSFPVDEVNHSWDIRSVFQLVGDTAGVDWEVENVTGVKELIETIKEKTGSIDRKIDAMLAA